MRHHNERVGVQKQSPEPKEMSCQISAPYPILVVYLSCRQNTVVSVMARKKGAACALEKHRFQLPEQVYGQAEPEY
jgi:hypothetical protein